MYLDLQRSFKSYGFPCFLLFLYHNTIKVFTLKGLILINSLKTISGNKMRKIVNCCRKKRKKHKKTERIKEK